MTGGLGFIGGAFIRQITATGADVVNVDAGTYAADTARISEASVKTHLIDVRDEQIRSVVADCSPDVVVHFAAETHVTRSEIDHGTFFASNVDGTRSILEAAARADVGSFIHISTDEVYGPALDHPFVEEDKLPGEGAATSAYARSKAVADDLARSFSDKMPVITVRPTNCFGGWQHPEKAIARWATRAISGGRLPVWGDGQQVRDWMFVEDLCSAIILLIRKGEPGGTYNVGPGNEAVSNLEIARAVAEAAGAGADSVYLTAYDRPAHDRRYSVDASKIRALGWRPNVGVAEGIRRTVEWYADNRSWWEPLIESAETLYQDDAERT